MNIVRFISKRKKIVGLALFFIILFGVYAVGKLDRELFPAISFDGSGVYVNAGQMSTQDVEQQITKPMEQMLTTINGVKSISSSSTIGASSITIESETGRGEEVFKEVEAAVKGLEKELPGVHAISAYQFSTDQSFEFFMTISNGSMKEISNFAKNVVKPRLEALPEVRQVSLDGIEEKEIIVELDLEKLKEVGIPALHVLQSVQQLNVDTAAASLDEEVGKPMVRWSTAMTNLEDIKNIEIQTMVGVKKISELANVYEEKGVFSSVGWNNGTDEFVFVQVGRTKEVTVVEMAASVRLEIEKIREEGLVNQLQLDELVAQADYVTNSIDSVSSNILIGGVLALVILILFLRNVRATIIIAISIPSSLLLTFITMYILDYSFNMLTLIGLGLGLGMMVDASIVILEAIYRKKEEGYEKLEAVVAGVREVASAVLASMLTTIAVFVPIGLLGGEMGQFMIVLSLIVIITLVSSVVVAFTVIPALCESFLKFSESKRGNETGIFISFYEKLITWLTRKKRFRYGMIVLFTALFIGSLALLTKIPMTVMPDVLNRYAEISVQLERGLTPAEREEVALRIHEKIFAVADIESNLIIDNIGSFYVLINMTSEESATLEQKEVNEALYRTIRDLEKSYPIESVSAAGFSSSGFPVSIEIQGDDLEELSKLSEKLAKELTTVEGLVGITSATSKKMPEEQIVFREKAMVDDGVTKTQLLAQFQEWSLRMPIGELKEQDGSAPIIITTNVASQSKEALLKQEIATINGEKPLSAFIELERKEVATEIVRKNNERIVTVFADIENRDLGSISRDIDRLLKEFTTPTGYSIKTGGSLAEQQETQEDMLIILALAIFLVYVVMAVQFNSFVHPLIIMSIIPITVTGAVLGLLATGVELSLMSGMGMIFLIGIVLNNGILLIDRTRQLRDKDYEAKEALVVAGKNRMRPIFMTTLTTVAGMLPLAIASGTASNYQAPLAIVIIFGLLFATFITLILIPSVYLLIEDIKSGIKKIVHRKEKESSQPSA